MEDLIATPSLSSLYAPPCYTLPRLLSPSPPPLYLVPEHEFWSVPSIFLRDNCAVSRPGAGVMEIPADLTAAGRPWDEPSIKPSNIHSCRPLAGSIVHYLDL
ncbi:hypothetical protein RRG08_035434 [Elysia crispata]|uniref:Uncharacterized protein n=1 Tax=Elysia crispata TaxID=231223 RepID=A0AAE1CS54_9GAST|nr:hypothetical protein RRG08_035434 [Elysia crispata]